MYLKRYVIPGFWRMEKKANKWAVRPMPGPHAKDMCIPLQVMLRDVLGYADNAKEAKKIIKEGKVLVDGVVRKDHRYPAGLMDVIHIPELKKYYRVSINSHGLFLKEISEKEADRKLCRINGKTTIKGGKMQLNLHDGRNIIVDKDVYKTGDSVLIKVPGQEILKHFKMEKGASAVIINGKNMGTEGKIKDIYRRKSMLEKSRIVIETKSGDKEVPLEYVMVGEI